MWFRRDSSAPAPFGAESPEGRFLVSLHVETQREADAMEDAHAFLMSLPERERPSELARIYLSWERARLGDGGFDALRSEAYAFLRENHPELLLEIDFRLVFERLRPQERLLCQRFLIRTLNYALADLGPRCAFLRPVTEWVTSIPDVTPPVPFDLRPVVPRRNSEWIALLYRLSRELYAKCGEKFADDRAAKCYERAFDDMTSRYGSLGSFPVIFNLLPPPLLDSDKLEKLSRSEIQKMLMRNLEDAAKVNQLLRDQNEKLDLAHRELEIAHAGLERRVAERTAELQSANEQLRNAKDHAEMADRAKSEFLANMSHELRTPLNAIMGFSEVIKDALFGPLDLRYREYAYDIHSSGEHLLAVINDILDLRKLESGRFELFEEDHRVGDLIRSCLEMIELRARNGKVALTLDVAPDLPMLYADGLRIRQILINLLSNAVKFTPEGGSVSIAARRDADDGLLIEVADTGIGIKQADISRALEPFRQISSPLVRKHEGTGLGLPLVKRLVEMHGGSFLLASEFGKGTSASVHFPASRLVPPTLQLAAG